MVRIGCRYLIDVFLRTPITQTKGIRQRAAIQKIAQALFDVKKELPNVRFISEQILDAQSQKLSLATDLSPAAFRAHRLHHLEQSDIFTFLHSNKTLSESGGGEALAWLMLDRFVPRKRHAVFIVQHEIETTLLKQFPKATYIKLIDSEADIKSSDATDYPNVIYCERKDLNKLTQIYKELLLKFEASRRDLD